MPPQKNIFYPPKVWIRIDVLIPTPYTIDLQFFEKDSLHTRLEEDQRPPEASDHDDAAPGAGSPESPLGLRLLPLLPHLHLHPQTRPPPQPHHRPGGQGQGQGR